LALFGYPMAHENDAERAARADAHGFVTLSLAPSVANPLTEG